MTKPSLTDEYYRTLDAMIEDIKQRLKDKGWSQVDFSDKSGLSLKVINRFLTKKTTVYNLMIIAQMYFHLGVHCEIKGVDPI